MGGPARESPPDSPRENPSDSSEESPLWALPVEEVYRRLGTGEGGLSEEEAARRLARHGPNELPRGRARPLWLRFLSQFTHFLALLLWVAGALAFAARTPELGWAIWAVVFINGSFSFWQEYRAERALAELRRMLPEQVRVVRGGRPRLLPARELVPGDLVAVEEGDRVSADARLVAAEGLMVDASLLTGESLPVAREAGPAPAAGPEAPGGRASGGGQRAVDRPNLLLAGTTVVSGRGRAVVYATGRDTEFGKVAHLTAEVERAPSTLERRVRWLVRFITAVAGGSGLAVFALALFRTGFAVRESFLLALGIVVALVPEGLLPMITLSLALGVQRMARRHALVRRLSAVETLSAVTVICTDKTGTLTQNELTVRYLWLPGRLVEVTGSGYAPEGCVCLPEDDACACGQALLLLAGGALCSNARLVPPAGGGAWEAVGDPTEAALVAAALKAGVRAEELARVAPRQRELPFDPWRRRMTVVVARSAARPPGAGEELVGEGGAASPPGDPWRGPWPGASHLAITKGAPLEVLGLCRWILRGDGVTELLEADRRQVAEANEALAARGLRVLAVAFRPGGRELLELGRDELEDGLVLAGLLAMLDPPRPGVEEALRLCRDAGIAVTMVTGDYGGTAAALARHIGLAGEEVRVVTGAELDAMSENDLRDLLRAGGSGLVFARTTPEQKLRLVQAYRALGHVVAVTGDGINDAPALHAAHVGIAMGRSGTDVAREAADVVLADDDFATIVAAVEQGRAVYQNIRKFMSYIMASNVAEVSPFLAMAALGVPPALNVLQILSVDLGTDLIPALSLGAEPPEPGLMREPPRAQEKPLLDRSLLLRAYAFLGLIEGAAGLAAFFGLWAAHGIGLGELRALAPALLGGTAEPGVAYLNRQATTLTLAAIVFCQAGNVFACRSERESVFRTVLRDNPLVWLGLAVEALVLAAVIYVPFLEAVFRTAPPPPGSWIYLLAGPFVLLAADEARKAAARRRWRASPRLSERGRPSP